MCRTACSSPSPSSSSTLARWGATTCTPSCRSSRTRSSTGTWSTGRRRAPRSSTWRSARSGSGSRTRCSTASTCCGQTSSRRRPTSSTPSWRPSRACAAASARRPCSSTRCRGSSTRRERFARSTGRSTTTSTSGHSRQWWLRTRASPTTSSTGTAAPSWTCSSEGRRDVSPFERLAVGAAALLRPWLPCAAGPGEIEKVVFLEHCRCFLLLL
mmetsp:Transcript_31631/g.101141  ORF Transcript_31631/g.101141 Transcript_31631/m.101141 type:complete len:213 (-) Transcript_31631:24-662(-)